MIKKAMRFNSVYPVYYLWILGHAYFLMDEYEEAIAAFKRTVGTWWKILFSGHSLLY